METEIEVPATRPVRSRLPRTLLTILALGALRLALVAPFPFSLEDYAVDDRLYVESAHHLGASEWLGPYDGRNLMKEIGFPLFIAGAAKLGIPLRLAQELLWILACGALSWLFVRLKFNWLAGTIGTAIVLFHPVAAPGNFGRILREHVYNSQILGILALGLVIVTMTRLRERSPWLVLLALLTIWTWHTREEGVWLAGILGLIVTAMLIQDRRRQCLRQGLLGALVLVTLVSTGLLGFRAFVERMNERHYGAAVFIESKDDDFRAALGAIIRAETQDEVRLHPIRRETLAGLYPVSPALASLRSTLESESFRGGWMAGPDGSRPTNAMGWALRLGAERNGHHESLPKAKAFYRELATELNAHLDLDPERYGPKRVSVFPPIRLHWWREVLSETWDAIADCWRLDLRFVGDLPRPAKVQVDLATAAIFREVIGQEELPARIARSERRNVLAVILAGHRRFLPWLGALGLAGLLLHVLRRRTWTVVLAASLILAATVLARALMVAALEIWFCPSRSTYLLCAMAPFAAGAWIGAMAGLAELVPTRIREGFAQGLDHRAVWAPALVILVIAALLVGRDIAENGRYSEVPLQLTSRVSPAEPLVMEASFVRREPSAEGLSFVALDVNPSIFVTLWQAGRRARPTDIKIAGRAETAGSQPLVFVCYGEGEGFSAEFRQPLPLAEDGTFDATFPLGARTIRALYLGGPVKPGSRFEIREFKLVDRP